MNNLNKEQDNIYANFEAVFRKQEEEMKNRQINEMDILYKDFEEKNSKKVIKYSKQLLELKVIEEGLRKLLR